MGRAFSSGGNKVPFRSLGSRNGGASGEGGRDEGITAFLTGANPVVVQSGDTNGADSALSGTIQEGEDGIDYENTNPRFVGSNSNMAQDITVTFLGTSSGGGPTKTRNCSSLVVDMLGDGTLWSACHPSNRFSTSCISYLHRLSGFRARDLNEGETDIAFSFLIPLLSFSG